MQTNWLWGYLIPVGILLLTWGGLSPRKARRVTPLVALALALAIIGYWLTGYAFHLGGAHALKPDDAALAGLDRIWSPLDRVQGLGWGFIGLAGFALSGDEVTPTALSLFLAYLPIMASSVLLVVLALAETRRWIMVTVGALTGAVVAPIAACWIWGGGWLSQLGTTLDLGHGFVDFGGSSLMLWLPASMAAGVLLLQKRQPVEEQPAPPAAYFPLLANLGALLIGVGWSGWALSAPFHTFGATLDWNQAALSAFLGMAGAVLTSQLYAWLVTGEIEPLMAARGLAAGWSAALSGAAFLPPWGALVIGLIAGLAFPLLLYLVEMVLRWKDSAATVALGLTGGLWGLLSTAFLADGRWGAGWNGIGAESAGVAGLIAGNSAQFSAQLIGLIALGVWGLLWGLLLGGVSRLSLSGLQGAVRSVRSASPPQDVRERATETAEVQESDVEPEDDAAAASVKSSESDEAKTS
jgi:Amt family ammonium transporter